MMYGKDHSDLADHQVESLELQAPIHDGPGVGDDRREAVHQPGVLDLLAAVERNVLGVVADPHQGVAVGGREQLVQEVQPDQRPADAEGEYRRNDHVDVCQEDHGSWDLETEDRESGRTAATG